MFKEDEEEAKITPDEVDGRRVMKHLSIDLKVFLHSFEKLVFEIT
jgi:hypothetical protein